ncbi:3',5'-nucleoside bisphosphate phosphatase [Listeria monocytogenes]|uniref:PHP domain-containing protein n=1 Tax=Listeria monocytogenes TaxID=1639 RepID=UPI000E715DA0|nr:PHP domain-containing protein [Listeria monocytogenes]RKA27963.1 3',5'-nucleoside bisphosphate phosphatase [Listeria monocytogenes]
MLKTEYHIHSDFSDGKLTPLDIIDLIQKQGIDVFSITDHYEIEANNTIKKILDDKKIKYIDGIEIDTDEEGLHILGYGIDCENYELKNELKKYKMFRMVYWEQILFDISKSNKINIKCKKLVDLGFNLTLTDLEKYLSMENPNSNTKKIIQEFINHDLYLKIKNNKFSVKKAIHLIKQANGVPVLAHLDRLGDKKRIKQIISEKLIPLGLKGLESGYPTYSDEFSAWVSIIADEFNLITTNGSDFHEVEDVVYLGSSNNVELYNYLGDINKHR